MSMTLGKTAADGDRLATLQVLRDRLAADLDECHSARDVASLAQRLMDVLTQIDGLTHGTNASKEPTGLDEFTARLNERDAPATGTRRTKRKA